MSDASHSMSDRILDAAERRARRGGYQGFSFRELAGDVGIKSASVHHHFSTKSELLAQLARRYRERSVAALGDPTGLGPVEAFSRVAAMLVDANDRADRMCLCGILGAESDALPPPVAQEIAAFFRALEAWMREAFGAEHRGPAPMTLLAGLEGALLIARTCRDPAFLHQAVRELSATLRESSSGKR